MKLCDLTRETTTIKLNALDNIVKYLGISFGVKKNKQDSRLRKRLSKMDEKINGSRAAD
jgi:hypothetical protein